MKRGDVILCSFPHSGSSPGKKRPALVIQSDHYNRRIVNLLVAGITGNLSNANDPAHYLVDISTPEGQQSGLHRDSLVSCINLAVLAPRNVSTKIGELPDDAMEKIGACLKVAMGI